MAQFTPRDEGSDQVAGSVAAAAASELRTALEREAAEIIARAREEGAGIEEAARRRAEATEHEARLRAEEVHELARARAAEIERHARARAEEARGAESDRIAPLVRAVDALEERMLTTIGELRRQLESSLTEVERAPDGDAVAPHEPTPENGRPPEPDASRTPPVGRGEADGADPGPAVALPGPVPLSVATGIESAAQQNPLLDEMMRAQVASMRDSGRSRAEAERFLGRFEVGRGYVSLLDEFYPRQEAALPPGQRSRRRRFGRRGS